MHVTVLSCLLLLALAAASGARAATVAEPSPPVLALPGEESDVIVSERLTRVFAEYVRAYHFSGSVRVSRHGRIIFSGQHGLADAGWGIPNARDTRYRIASLTKAFTALAVLKLHQDGRLDIDEPLERLVSGLDSRITPRHLLLHRAGLGRDPVDLSDKGVADRFSLAEIIEIAGRSPLAFDPGSDFLYSNLGYSVLAAAIEAASGQTYDAAVHRLVLAPFALGDTANEPSVRPLARLAKGYFLLPDGIADASPEDKSHVIGAGSFVSSADDLVRFLDSLEASPAFTPETLRLFLRESAKNRTLGLVTWEYKVAAHSTLQPRLGRVVMHSGSCPGYEASFGRFLDHGISIVILANQSPFPAASLFNDLGNASLGFATQPELRSELPFYRAAIAVEPKESLVRNPDAGDPTPGEREINRMGYNLLGAGRNGDAIRLFRLNTLLHPDSPNTHDSLGAAYLAIGDRSAALTNYRRVLSLAPGNPAAMRAIRKIELGGDDD